MKKKKSNTHSKKHGKASKCSPANQKHKDRLFRLVFQEKKDLLDLYNALNGTSYDDPDALEITTLEDAVFLGIKNDVSFIVGASMNLYEHQSSRCENMPLRGLIYFSTLYQTYVKERGYNLYGSRRIPLPFPNFIVFYNGEQDEPDESEMLLSEAFLTPPRSGLPSVECRVKIRNINRGHSPELMQKCQRLREYAEFIGCIRENQSQGMKFQKAVSKAMKTCQKNGILADLLARCQTEVLAMLLAEYDEKETLDYIRKESEAIGREKGEDLLAELFSRLFADNRQADIQLAVKDKKARKRLYKEYHLK